MKKKFGIKILSLNSGVSEYNIRSWEKRYSLLTPQRTTGGHRLYSNEDVYVLTAVNKLIQNGYSVSQIAKWPRKELLKYHKHNIPLTKTSTKKNLVDPQVYILGIILALQHLNTDLLEHELLKAREELSTEKFIIELVMPCMKRVGEMYASNEISVAQEHLISSLVRSYLYPLIGGRIKSNPQYSKEHIAILTPENEWHEIGILAVAALLNTQGFKCSYLGVNTPFESLQEFVNSVKITKVVIGISDYSVDHNSAVHSFMKNIKKLPPHIEVFVGGLQKSSFNKLPGGRRAKFIDRIDHFN